MIEMITASASDFSPSWENKMEKQTVPHDEIFTAWSGDSFWIRNPAAAPFIYSV